MGVNYYINKAGGNSVMLFYLYASKRIDVCCQTMTYANITSSVRLTMTIRGIFGGNIQSD